MATTDLERLSALPPEFQQAADPAAPVIEPPKVMVSLPVDADVLAFFQSELTGNWQDHMNDILRNFMESHLAMEAEFEAAAELATITGQNQPEPPGPA
jgi:uncharacterized protein (DUF4415 family)